MKSYSIKSVILAVFLIGTINPAEARFEDGQIINLRSALSTNRFVAPRDGSSADRAYISIHSERGAKKDPINWTLDIAGGGYFYLKGASGKVMEVKNGSSNARTSVWLKRKTGSDAQKFKFRSAGNGYYYIVPKINPNLVLDVKGGYTYEGAGIWTHPHNGTKAQKFRVIEALKQYQLAVTLLRCTREDDPGNGIEVYGKITAKIEYRGEDNRVERFEYLTLWSVGESKPLDMQVQREYINTRSPHSFYVTESDFNTEKIFISLFVDMWEHDGSSANDRFECQYRSGLGTEFLSGSSLNSTMTNIIEGGTVVNVHWSVRPAR